MRVQFIRRFNNLDWFEPVTVVCRLLPFTGIRSRGVRMLTLSPSTSTCSTEDMVAPPNEIRGSVISLPKQPVSLLLAMAVVVPLVYVALVALLKGEQACAAKLPSSTVGRLFNRIIDCEGCNSYVCYEKLSKCGPKGYLMHFGYKNCKIFNDPETHKKMHPAGVQFTECTTSCLLAKLDELFSKKHVPGCGEITDSSFDAHVACYLKCGFCDVCKTEKMSLLSSYDLADFFSFRAVKQVYAIIKKCGVTGCFT